MNSDRAFSKLQDEGYSQPEGNATIDAEENVTTDPEENAIINSENKSTTIESDNKLDMETKNLKPQYQEPQYLEPQSPRPDNEVSTGKPPKRRIAEACAFIIAIILIASTVAIFIQNTKKTNAPTEICTETGITVQITNGLPPTLTNDQVISHLGTFGSFVWQEVDGSSFSCVDGRGTNPEIGTPGGDFSEFLLGLNMTLNLPIKPIHMNAFLTSFKLL